MGDLSKRIARVDVLIGGVQQAKDQVELMREEMKRLSRQADAAKTAMEKAVNTVKYDAAKEKFAKLSKEVERYNKAIRDTNQNINTVEKYLTNVSGQTLRNLNQAKKQLNQMLLSIKPENTDALDTVRNFIKQVTDEAQRRKGLLVEFSDVIQHLGTVSDASLAASRKRLEELLATTDKNSTALQSYRYELAMVAAEERKRKADSTNKILGNLGGSTVNEIRDAIKAAEQLRDAQTRGSSAWERYNQQIKDANKYLDDFTKSATDKTMTARLNDLRNASAASLAEQKKYWQDMANSVDLNNAKLAEYQRNLQKINDEEELRIGSRARNTMASVQTGTFSGTITETKDAIKLMEQYKQTLMTFDTAGIKDVDEAISALKEKLNAATGSTMSLNEAVTLAGQVSEGKFDGTNEDLEKLKKNLHEIRSKLKMKTDAPDIKRVDEALSKLGDSADKAGKYMADVDKTLKDIDRASMRDLKSTAEQLQTQLEENNREWDEFTEKSAQLRQVNTRIKEINQQWEAHDNQIKSTIKRLTSYVLVYSGFNFVKDKIGEAIRLNAELSDSLANIRKTTGMTRMAVAELSQEIDKIDTRTSQKELHDLAYEAGKLGLKAQEDVLGFVKAGNQLIGALGEDLGGPEAVRTLMKINDLLGETKRLGVEKALLATGSAINELSQNSTASAGPIADIVARLGAVGAQSKLTMADLIAIGGTADELSQDAEVVGTAISKFVTSMQTNTHAIAQAIDVDDAELNRLMDAGHTMDAILLVMEKMGKMNIKEIDPIMKEFGSDGERLIRVVNALSGNVDTLRARVKMSNEAFKEAHSVTNEYAILNESTAAIWERWLNKMNEIFVNSANEGALRNLVQTLYKLTGWVERNKETAKWVLLTIGSITLYVKLQAMAWQKNMSACLTSLDAMKKGLASFGKSLKKNWIGLLLTAAAATVTYFTMFRDKTKSAIESAAKFGKELQLEQMHLEKLFHDLKQVSKEMDKNSEKKVEYKRILDSINKEYGEYLGFQLSELDNASKLAAAQQLINTRLSETIALRLKAKMNAESEEKYGSIITSSTVGMNEKLVDMGHEKYAGEVIGAVHSTVTEHLDKSVEELITLSRKAVQNQLADIYGGQASGYGMIADKMHKEIREYIEARKDFARELKQTDDFVQSQIDYSHKQTVEKSLVVMEEIKKEYAEHSKKFTEATTEVDKKKNEEEMVRNARQYLTIAKKIQVEKPEMLDKKQWEDLNATAKAYERTILDITGVLNEPTIWGKGMSLEKASVTQLVAKYKELFNERKTIKDDADYTKVYGAKFRDRKAAFDWFMEQLKIVEKRLNDMGYDKNGNFLKDKKGRGNSGENEAKKKVNAALAALEAYYNREQQVITDSYLSREITEEEYHRRSNEREEQFLHDRILLRRRILKKQGGEQFEPGKYVHKDAETGEVTEYFKGKNLDTLVAFVNKMGDRLKDGILKNLTVDELAVMNKELEHMRALQKIILEDNFTGQVDKQYQEHLEKMELFWGLEENRTDENGKKRLEIMKRFADESYAIDAKGLEEKMAQEEDFSDWRKNRTAEDYEALLVMLRKYYDDTEMAERRGMERRQKIVDQEWRDTGRKEAWEEQDNTDERTVNFVRNLRDVGILDEGSVEDTEIAMYRHRLEAATEYYNKVLEMGGKREEAMEKMKEAAVALEEAEVNSTKRKLGILKNYTDAVVDFSYQMGEAAFGEVEDRKAAAKQLLRTTMELTKNLIMEGVKHLIMKKTLKQQEIVLEGTTATAVSTIHGTQAMTDLSVTGAKTAGDVAAGIASGSAKTVGQLGWWGIPLIAAISAALSALMGMAMAKMNKAKKEVASAAGVGDTKSRIAAGMLTYAKGDYPILGNDGKVYNARYHDKLQTGVYGGGHGRAHFGLFSEKKPEMIVDGDTTQKLIVDYPHLYESILTIAHHGRLRDAGMPAFAAGAYPVPAATGISGLEGMGDMPATLQALTRAVEQLDNRLQKPIKATMNPYDAVHQLDKADQFLRQTGQK